MNPTYFSIDTAPAVLYGEENKDVFLFVHGLCGNKEEAARFFETVSPFGFSVLAIDLPEHGGRTDAKKLVPWDVVPELQAVLRYAREHFSTVSLRTVSIGTWFSLQAFRGETIKKCLFSSPLLDMEEMIRGLMAHANVSEERLKDEGEIPTDLGQTLSWRYLTYVRDHPVSPLCRHTSILYATEDETIPRKTIDAFVSQGGCTLTLYEGGRHWLNTEEELSFMREWERKALSL